MRWHSWAIDLASCLVEAPEPGLRAFDAIVEMRPAAAGRSEAS
jgi:hypothetical protein